MENQVDKLPCPKCGTKTEGSWQDYDWYPNEDGWTGAKWGPRHRHGLCPACGYYFCELNNPMNGYIDVFGEWRPSR